MSTLSLFRRPRICVAMRLSATCLLLLSMGSAYAQLPDAPEPSQEPTAVTRKSGRILGVIPNFRSLENGASVPPLTTGEKFKTAALDSFDFSSFLVAGFLGGISLAQNQYPEFGHGAQAVGKYYGTAFADQAVGNFMTEAVFPTAFHQDPRYFVMTHGGFRKRTWYAVSREWITRGDNGRSQFNVSELGGNLAAAGISNAYYPSQERTVGNTFQKWGVQIATDAFFNVMKEYWPDVRQHLPGRRASNATSREAKASTRGD